MSSFPKISQSLIKGYYDYLQGKSCGILFREKYINKNPDAQTPPSNAMKLGIYFEYRATGALPKDKKIPEAEVVYKGQAREKLSEAYLRAEESAKKFKQILSHYKIKIKKIGHYLSDGNIDGVVDIWAEWDGQDVFIDLKYSGLIDDKWNEMGWELESLPLKDSIMIQGVHYKILAKNVLGIDDIPFYYFVFDMGDPNNIRIIKQNVDETRLLSHEAVIRNVKYKLSDNIQNGFKANPTMQRCHECPLKSSCEYAVNYPLIDEIYY